MSQGQGHGGPPRRPPSGQKSPSPFRGTVPFPPGWSSPIPLRMTQSPPPFLIRPMVGRHSPASSRSPSIGSPIPMFGLRWSPAGSPVPPPPNMMPIPPNMKTPNRQYFHPIAVNPTAPFRHSADMQHDGFQMQPSYDMELVYPPGLEMGMQREMSIQSEEDSEGGLTTAEMIERQSQDYIDERLAEYQATIQHLQDEQERVQKKTFVNWINSYLAKHIPPLHLVDLIEDLKDGTRLLALLEVLSNERLPLEKGRNLRRPHFLSNCNTALQFLQSKKIKLVNINSSDVVDGKPAVVLGLVWTIILYFQLRCRDRKVIEENTRVLTGLGYRLGQGTPIPVERERPESVIQGTESPSVVHKHGRVTPSERWKHGARKALLQWVQGLVNKKFGLSVNDFGNSWRDGYAFLAIINSIRPGLVDLESVRMLSNRERLEIAFRVAEQELGVPRLLDPEDVDVPRPDEKSIMTYVAQFLHKSNEPLVQADSFSAVQAIYDELLTWLMQRTQYMEHMKQTNALSTDYRDYLALQEEMNLKTDPYHRLQTLVESVAMVGITEEAWLQLKSLWKKLETQLREWHWRLDSCLPFPFGGVGQWLAKAELLLSTSDVPAVMDDEAARILNAKIEDHKEFFGELSKVYAEFTAGLNLPIVNDLPQKQIESMAARLNAVGPLAAKRVVKLKFLEHKCCLVAFVVLVENRLKQWTIKYGRQHHVQMLLEQYNNFVNRNKIFQEFQRAYIDMQHVVDEYKREGGIDHREGRTADHFLWEIGERWKSLSMELRCVQSMLEEVIAHWRRYDSIAPELDDWIDRSLPMIQLPEDDRMQYFQDIGIWLEKYNLLNETVSFLVATCDTPITNELKHSFAKVAAKWENLFSHVKQYQHAGQMLRMKKDFIQILSGLQQWLRNAEKVLLTPQTVSVEAMRVYNDQLQQIQDEIDGKDDQWREISKRFQSLLPELPKDEVDRLMQVIKNEKESLVTVRGQLPQRQAAIHQLLTQQEALETGQREIADWLNNAEILMNSYTPQSNSRNSQDILDQHRQFFSKLLYYKTMLESKNKLLQGISNAAGPNERAYVDVLSNEMKKLNTQFKNVEENSRIFEQKLQESIRCWKNYEDSKQVVMDWVNKAEKLLNERNLESKHTVQAHKAYFEQINNRPLNNLIQASQDLLKCASPEDADDIHKTVEHIQLKWNRIMASAPIHLTKLEFRLEEEELAALLKEMDREIGHEHQLLSKRENTQMLIARHTEFFENGKVPLNAKKCLEKLIQIESRFSVQHPLDKILSDQLHQARTAYESVTERAKNVRVMLEEIPEQWKTYRSKFAEVVRWMDSVDASLRNIMAEVKDAEQFESEKAKFLGICRDVDLRRDDMKELVQLLDSLVSRRPEEDALKEQDLLEKLIQRYKNLVPTIEVTMIKTETHSRCYTFREETKKVCQVLERIDKINTLKDIYPGSLEEVQEMINQQLNVLRQLEGQRATIVSLLQRGRDLQKDPNAPEFVQSQVHELDTVWSDVYSQSSEKLTRLKDTHTIWVSYRSQRDDILHLLEDAETELKKLTTQEPGQISEDLKLKQEMSKSLREATEHTLIQLRELSESLSRVSHPDHRPVLENEIVEIERRLHTILDLLENKIKHLLTHDENWGRIMAQIEELRNWMINAQKVLEQLTKMDMPPEERDRKTKALQVEIAQKMKILQDLEKEARGLLAGDSVPESQEVKVIAGDMDALKAQFVSFHDTVQAQSAQSAQALEVYSKCKGKLEEFKPWLDKAEVKVAVTAQKPATLEEAILNAKQIEEFALECKSQQAELSNAASQSGKISGLTSIYDDVDTAKSKLASMNASVAHIKEKSGNLLKAWQDYEISYNQLEGSVNQMENLIAEPSHYAETSLPGLEAQHGKLKDLSREISARQSQLILLSQSCDSLAHHISPETAATLNANIQTLKAKLSDLADKSRAEIADLSDLIMSRLEYESKVADLELWMDKLAQNVHIQDDIYLERLENSLQQISTLSVQHNDHRPNVAEIYMDVKRLSAKSPPGIVPSKKYSEISAQFENLDDNLLLKKNALTEWIELKNWYTEIKDSVIHLQKQLSSTIEPERMKNIELEILQHGEKCREWKPKAQSLDLLSKKAGTVVKDTLSGNPLTAQGIVSEMETLVSNLKVKLDEKKNLSDKLSLQKEKLSTAQAAITNIVKESQEAILSALPEYTDLPSLQKALAKLDIIKNRINEGEKIKAEVHTIGAELLKTNPENGSAIQGTIQLCDSNLDQVRALLSEKQDKCSHAINLWKNYADANASVEALLNDAEKLYVSVISNPPKNAASIADSLDQLRKCNIILDQSKSPMISSLQIEDQLKSAVSSFGYLDFPGNNELSLLKTRKEELQRKVGDKVSALETQLVLLKGIESDKTELIDWLTKTYETLEASEESPDSDTGRKNLEIYKNELGDKYNSKISLESKIAQLCKLDGSDEAYLTSILATIDEGFSQVDKLASELDETLTVYESKKQSFKKELKDISDKVSDVKESIAKCEDRTGEPVKIVERILTLQKLKGDIKNLKSGLDVLQKHSVDLKTDYPESTTSNAEIEVKGLAKRLETCSTQLDTNESGLKNVLEKRFWDKYHVTGRLIGVLVEKLKWCDLATICDAYSLQNKQAALAEIEQGIEECKKNLPDMQDSLSYLHQAQVLDNINELTSDYNKLINDLDFVQRNHAVFKTQVNEFSTIWENYETLSEDVNTWLKGMEDKIKAETGSLIKLPELETKLSRANNLVSEASVFEPKVQELLILSERVLELSPESRVGLINLNVNNRMQQIYKSAVAHQAQLEQLKSDTARYNDALKVFNAWITDAEATINSLDDFIRVGGKSAQGVYSEKIIGLTKLLDSKDGPKFLQAAVEYGEAIIPGLTVESKESVRGDAKKLRERWEQFSDKGRVLLKQMEATQLQWASLEHNQAHILSWFDDLESQCGNLDELQPTLQDKKTALRNQKALLQDISAKSEVISSHRAKLEEVSDDAALKSLDELSVRYLTLKNKIQGSVQKLEGDVANHERYAQSLLGVSDNLKKHWNDFQLSQQGQITGEQETEACLAQNRILLQNQDTMKSQLDDCKAKLEIVIARTHPDGHPAMHQELKNLLDSWNGLMKQCKESQNELEKARGKLTKFNKDVADLLEWVKQKEIMVKDQSFKNNAEAKVAFLEKLQDLASAIATKEPEFVKIAAEAQALDGNQEAISSATLLQSRYQCLIPPVKELINRYTGYVQDHKLFSSNQTKFLDWMDALKSELGHLNAGIGDVSVLQQHRAKLSLLKDRQNAKAAELEALVESGERLYSHTSPDGREVIRQQIRVLRDTWEAIGDQIHYESQRVDTCLSEFEDFTLTQEELTKWLRGVEQAMHVHTQLKATLPEKRAQLQSHKIVNQEISSRQPLVEAVCDKAQQLVVTTKDESLQVYITSIKQLFQNIKEKSASLLKKLETGVEDHKSFDEVMQNFNDWLAQQKNSLSTLNDVSGEKSEVVKRIEQIQSLKAETDVGRSLLNKSNEIFHRVSTITSESGSKSMEGKISQSNDAFADFVSATDQTVERLASIFKHWEEFEKGLQENTQWFRQLEAVFRAQVLHGTLAEKTDAVKNFVAQREIVLNNESNIHSFLDHSNDLLRSSNSERIKPLILQISNRYQLLHVLSKEVVHRWQGIVDDHQAYDTKLEEALSQLSQFENKYKATEHTDSSVDRKTKEIQTLVNEKENLLHLINVVETLGEKLFPDTSVAGRDKIRQDLRSLKERFDATDACISNLQKKQLLDSQQWAAYQEQLQQIQAWLAIQEKATENEQPNWFSIQDTRSKLMKLKTILQDSISHRRVVEGVLEKTKVLITRSVGPSPTELEATMEDLSTRYEALLNNLLVSITGMEETLDSMQQRNDTQKRLQDWQNNMREQIDFCANYNGGKPAIETRLKRVQELQGTIGEGQALLDSFHSVFTGLSNVVPLRAKEGLERDVVNTRLEHEKLVNELAELRHSLEDRLKQFVDYDEEFGKIIEWLNESECALKDYTLCDTLEEKEIQYQKYQDISKVLDSRGRVIQDFVQLADSLQKTLLANVNQKEPKLQKLELEATNLSQSTGDTRIHNNTQQISSRFHAIQNATKEVLKKCEKAIKDHRNFRENCTKFAELLRTSSTKAHEFATQSQVPLEIKLQGIRQLLGQRASTGVLLATIQETGEMLYPSTGKDGTETVRAQLDEAQRAFDSHYDNLSSIERDMNTKMNRMSAFEENKLRLKNILKEISAKLSGLELKTTLDEKKAQLQKYRNLLQEVMSHQQDVFEMKDQLSSLTEESGKGIESGTSLIQEYHRVQATAEKYVTDYEYIVCTHQQYVKAVQDFQEWLEGTNNSVLMWGDENQDRVTLHANLSRLKNLKASLPDEAYRVEEIQSLGEKVLPGTVESGQRNIKTQLDASQQDWVALRSYVESTEQALQLRLGHWHEFETDKVKCMEWLKATDAKLHAVDLKPTLTTKVQQLNALQVLQGEVRAQEIEVDAISEKALNLQRQVLPSRSSSASALDLTTKYQQVCSKIKELTNKWQDFVTEHQHFESGKQDCERWLDDMKNKLLHCSDLSTSSQKELEGKLTTIHDLIIDKDEGYGKVQSTVEAAQAILANTATEGHQEINDSLEKLQSEWSSLAAKMLDTKNQLDQSIHLWSGFLEQIQELNKTVEYAESVLESVAPFAGTLQEKKAQLESILALEEKLTCEKPEVESLNSKAVEMVGSGQQTSASAQALAILKKFDVCYSKTKQLRNEREQQYRDHKSYKEAQDELMGWLTRTREKIPSFRQRSLGDKLFDVETANATFLNLMNKKPQGGVLIERLQQAGAVAMANSSESGKNTIEAETRALNESFEALFVEIEQQKQQLDSILSLLREWKEEYERLSDWLQQCDILIKATKTTMSSTIEEKKKQVKDIEEVNRKLQSGQPQMDQFNRSAKPLLASHLDSYVANLLRTLNSRFQVLLNTGNDVLKKFEANLEQHEEFLSNYTKSHEWMAHAREVIRESLESTSSSKKERLQADLAKIQSLIDQEDVGQGLVHACISWGEKAVRNTRSDGRDTIETQMKEVQTEWDKIVKKIAAAKISLESNLLQWEDYNSSYSQVEQWISDREAKLKQVAGQRVTRGKKGGPGLSSLSIGDRKATLRATNTVVQDIISLEPMIESITTKAGNLSQGTPASEITAKYKSLSKRAQEIYAKQKEMVEHHEAFVDLANDFMGWIRIAKEKLNKISEPVGDRDMLSGKIAQLKVLQSDTSVGQDKLNAALAKGSDACDLVDDEDRDIIEEEVAILQEEFDNYSESLSRAQQILEIGLVGWREWEDQYKFSLEWLNNAETRVKSFHVLQNSLTEKKTALERFQQELQTVFEWQKELDNLNLRAQQLLQTCADSRISSAVTQVSTKFNALLSLAKEVIRRLELQYQEHQQYNSLSSECQDWVEKLRERLANLSEVSFDLTDANSRLLSLKTLKQTLEQGQNKLRYVLELKEKVVLTTEPSGAAKIEEDTNLLKNEFTKVIAEAEELRRRLNNRISILEEIEKAHKNLSEWLDEIEGKISLVNVQAGYADIGDKRATLEKLKGLEKEIWNQAESFVKFENKIQDLPDSTKNVYLPVSGRYAELKATVGESITKLSEISKDHDNYLQQAKITTAYLRKARLELQQYADLHGEKSTIDNRLSALESYILSLNEGEKLLAETKALGEKAMEVSNRDCKDQISHECRELKADYDNLLTFGNDSKGNLLKCSESWAEFDKSCDQFEELLHLSEVKVKSEMKLDKATPSDLERVQKLSSEISSHKLPLEILNDKSEALFEMCGSPDVRNKTLDFQSRLANLMLDIQSLITRIQKGLTDHSEFLRPKAQLEELLKKLEESISECYGFGNHDTMKEKLETLKMVSGKLTEGHHLLSQMEDAYTHLLSAASSEEQSAMRNAVTKFRERLEKINADVNQGVSRLRDALQRGDNFKENMDGFEKWCATTEAALKDVPKIKELGDMKTCSERYRMLGNDIKAEKANLDNLQKEAVQMSQWSNETDCISGVEALARKWQNLDDNVNDLHAKLQDEIKKYTDYQLALQDIEKWLLQTSFQLMAHNSLCITNREQTLDQLMIHDALLEQINAYKTNIDNVKVKGDEQIKRYSGTIPTIQQTIEKQLANLKDSYDSLLHTGLQIKNRLIESLAKFEEYENTLDSIMKNLDEWEPIIAVHLDTPIRNINEAGKKMEYIRLTHNNLQGEKNRLSLSVQACAAAMASLSRPASPQETLLQPIPDKELAVRARLEELIDESQTSVPESCSDTVKLGETLLPRVPNLRDQVAVKNAFCKIDDICHKIQSHMTGLSSMTTDLDDIRAGKDVLAKWSEEARSTLKEIENRPAKFRPDLVQTEMNQLQDIQNGVEERLQSLMELEMQESSLVEEKYLPNLQELLSEVEAKAKEVLTCRLDIQAKIDDYRTQVSIVNSLLDKIAAKLQDSERGVADLPCNEKVKLIEGLAFELGEGHEKLTAVKSKADDITKSLSPVDVQLLQEQLKALERRFTEIKKRIDRRKELLLSASKGFTEFQNDLQALLKSCEVFSPNLKIGYQVDGVDALQSALKTKSKELEGQQVLLSTLERRLNSLKTELEDKEIKAAEHQLAEVTAKQSVLSDELRRCTLGLNDALVKRRKFMEDTEQVKAWTRRLSSDIFVPSTVPLNAADVEREINSLKRIDSLTNDYLETTFADLINQAGSLERDCDAEQSKNLAALVSDLKNAILKVQLSAKASREKLMDSLKTRQEFEKNYSACETWLQQAEIALASDIRSLTNVNVIQDQISKYKILEGDAQRLNQDLRTVNEEGSNIMPSLSDPDRQILKDRLANLNSKLRTVSVNVVDKLGNLEAILKEMQEAFNILEMRRKFIAAKRAEFQELMRQHGNKVEDSQLLLSSIEVLLGKVKQDRIQSDSPKLSSNDLRAIMKEEDDLITSMEEQITRLRHLILLRQQYLASVAEITGFIDKYSEIVKGIDNSGEPIDGIIRRYADVISRIQEVEANLSTTTDKGIRLADEGSPSDRNAITEQLQSLKQRLHALRLETEDKKAEHELTAAEHKRFASELDTSIAWLHEREATIKSRPVLEKSVGSIESELRLHDKLADEVSQHLLNLQTIEEALGNEDCLPSALMDKLSESRLLTKTFPIELENRRKYLESNKELRETLARNVASLTKWAKDTDSTLKTDLSNGIDMQNVDSLLADDKMTLGNEQEIIQQLQNTRHIVDKILPTVKDVDQESLSKDMQNLNELIQNTFNSSKSRQAHLEQCSTLWKNFIERFDAVKANLQKLDLPEERATSLASLKNVLSMCQSGLLKLQNENSDLQNLDELAKSVEKMCDPRSRLGVQERMADLNRHWQECRKKLEEGRDSTGKLVTEWERCEILWQTFETGLAAIQEHFSQIDPSIRSHQQLQETKEAVQNVLMEAKNLSSTHAELLRCTDCILKHLSSASVVGHDALKSKLDNLSSQYIRILALLEERLDWLNSQDQYLEEVDVQINLLSKKVAEISDEVKEIGSFDPDFANMDNKIRTIQTKVDGTAKNIQAFGTGLKNRFASLKQLLPPSISRSVSDLELEMEKVAAELEAKKQQLKRARNALNDYTTGLEFVRHWISQAEERLQDRAAEPHLLKDNIQSLISELPTVTDKLDNVKSVSSLLIQNTDQPKEKENIVNSVQTVDADFSRVKTLIEERQLKIAESMDSWQRFLQLYNLVMKWVAEKKQFLEPPLQLTSLPETRVMLNNYSINVKSLKTVGKQLSEMGREIDRVAEVSSATPLHEKLVEAEQLKTEIEALLLERNALIQETTEEWEQCEKKLREVALWLDKTAQTTEAPVLKRKPLRDQLASNEKLLADIHVQKTKISLSLEKLQVHFKSGIGGDPNIEKEEAQLQNKLDNFNQRVKDQCNSLESSISQVDKLHEEIQLLRNQLITAEQQLRHSSSPAYQSMDPQKAELETTAWKERLKSIQSKIASKNERVKLLMLCGVPSPVAEAAFDS